MNEQSAGLLIAKDNWQWAKEQYQQSEVLIDSGEIQRAIESIARGVESYVEAHELGVPMLMCTVMKGGLFFASRLYTQLQVPFEEDYLHATRYGANQTGSSELTWIKSPSSSVVGRHVCLVDDILDEGLTLFHIKEELYRLGAAKVLIAVLSQKEHGKVRPIEANFIGVKLPNAFVFGCGMDLKGYYRGLDHIRAKV